MSSQHPAGDADNTASKKEQNSIRVAVYNASERYSKYTTGVGKHVKHAVSGLEKQVDISVEFWVPKDYWLLDQECIASTPLHQVKSSRLPISRRMYKGLTTLFRRPFLDSYTGDVDWVYSPREIFTPTKHAKTALTIHDVFHFEPAFQQGLHPSSIVKWRIWSQAAQSADLILTVSNFTKQRICELFSVDESKISVIGNGAEQSFFDIYNHDPEEISQLPGTRYFVSIGAINAKKGANALLSFAEVLQRQNPKLKLVNIGPVEPVFHTQVNRCNNIIIVDRGIDDSAVVKWVRGAIALVMLSEYEGFGIPVVEAMAAGVPVIASDRAALPETVGNAGIIVSPHSIPQIEDAAAIWDDPNLRNALIKRGRRRASELTWDRCVDHLSHALLSKTPTQHKHTTSGK